MGAGRCCCGRKSRDDGGRKWDGHAPTGHLPAAVLAAAAAVAARNERLERGMAEFTVCAAMQ